MGRQTRSVRAGEGTPFVSATTGTAVPTIPNHGVSNITSTAANSYVLDAPVEGVRKTLCSVTSTSAAVVIRGSTGTSVKFGNQGATQITMASTTAIAIELLGLNSTQWIITGNFIAAETTGIVVGTS